MNISFHPKLSDISVQRLPKERPRNGRRLPRPLSSAAPGLPGRLPGARGLGCLEQDQSRPKASLPSLCLQRDTGAAGDWGATCWGSWVRLWGGGRAAWAQPTLGEPCRGPGLPGELQGCPGASNGRSRTLTPPHWVCRQCQVLLCIPSFVRLTKRVTPSNHWAEGRWRSGRAGSLPVLSLG